ncbi:hypothetical protein F2P81_001278 [Scophthalmus maximus]|uniref:Uncharacterized protein n=1 Tax=Scophthalmus maximus TaxID=52904 RepID=A0A6A4TQV3_SCOMX|nr:hypothetical protein F2P81_001278 [Scophthalmus maximus]
MTSVCHTNHMEDDTNACPSVNQPFPLLAGRQPQKYRTVPVPHSLRAIPRHLCAPTFMELSTVVVTSSLCNPTRLRRASSAETREDRRARRRHPKQELTYDSTAQLHTVGGERIANIESDSYSLTLLKSSNRPLANYR